ncbi:flavin-containing monooxygenase [Acinetobacter rongchengensis]|uniref:FAD-binding protein n=1 Tax=Acinetobacter rongchengensis TaxID=2419601 RepID=A0A3A8F0U6_9GAMM|nr:NAD(P)/FAD-dependent oxidoreductase [Acinetobacter rongchengensis]RKG40038.1 FAD-binding protein [Acinetobacter rongchengensis]
MNTQATLDTLLDDSTAEKKSKQSTTQTTVEDIKQVTQLESLEPKSLEENKLEAKRIEVKKAEAQNDETKSVQSRVVKAEIKIEPQTESAQKTKRQTTVKAKNTTQTAAKTANKQVPGTQADIPVHTYDSIVIGAGISGIAAAYKMKQAGYQDYIVLEKASRVGGTWRDNNYPGCGCDVPSALYSFSFSPSHKWSHLFAKQPEILSYLEEVVEKYDLGEKIEFNNELISARWDEAKHIWNLETSKGQYQARTVLFTTGPITEPSMPKLKGIEGFKGEMFHSARWNHDYDLTNKRVAVIGTGASAIQFIPQVQPKVKQLFVFQRTAPWVLPKADMQLNDRAKQIAAQFPIIQQTWRNSIAQILNGINFGLRHPKVLEPISFLSKQLLKLQIDDDQLRKNVTPNFAIGCKRLLFANNYYPALQQDNVHLIPHGLIEIDGNTLIAANGERHEVDVIIWGTGFEVSHPPIGKRVYDTTGQTLAERWKGSSPEAYLGASIEKVPNAFLVLGPNILVYDSFIGIAEAQIDYIVDGLLKMRDLKFTRFEIKKDVIRKHNIKVQKQLQSTVFNVGGCKSYYLDENGRNFAAWPWSLKQLKSQLKTLDLKHYDIAS